LARGVEPPWQPFALVPGEDCGVLPLTAEEAFRSRRVGKALDRAVDHAQLAADQGTAVTGFQLHVDGGVPGPDAIDAVDRRLPARASGRILAQQHAGGMVSSCRIGLVAVADDGVPARRAAV
jgi:hypothetical protein